MRIDLTGQLRVHLEDGSSVEGSILPGRQARTVFAYLASTPEPVPTGALAEAVWPGMPPGGWRRDLAAVVSKVRARLRQLGLGPEACLRRTDDGYQLVVDPRPVVDVDVAVLDVAAAETALGDGDLDAAGRAARAALETARRPFLPGAEGEWARMHQETLDDVRLRSLDVLAQVEDPATAARRAEEAVSLRPLREAGHLQAMRAHLRAGSPAEALRAYDRCRRLLRDELGVDPAPPTRALFEQLLRGRGDPPLGPRSPLPVLVAVAAEEPMVGREQETAVLGALLEQCCGRPRLAFLTGDPGVGKTSLAAHFARARHHEGASVLAGRCDRDATVPYQPFAEALTGVARAYPAGPVRAVVEQWSHDLRRIVPDLTAHDRGPEAPTVMEPDTARHRLFEAVTATVAAIAATGPTVLLVDDLHWADPSTLAMLRHLLRYLPLARDPAHLLVLATCRDGEVDAHHPLTSTLADLFRDDLVHVVPVRNLTMTEVATLVNGSAALAERVHQVTTGNPFFVRQLVRHLAETGGGLEGPQAGLPPGIIEVVRRRLSLLHDDGWRCVTVGAVVGQAFDAGVVAEVTGLPAPTVLAALEQACAFRFLTEIPEGPGFAFAHDIVRQAVYAQVGHNRRALLHRSVAEALERRSPEPSAELARHYAAAGHACSDRAAAHARKAAEAASRGFAHDEAARFYDMALTAHGSRGGPTRVELLLGLGIARARAGDPSAADPFRQAAGAARDLRDGALRARVALAATTTWSPTGTVDADRVTLLDEALAALPPQEPGLRARLLSHLAIARFWEPDPAPRAALSGAAVELARKLADPATLALCLDADNTAVWKPGNAVRRRTAGREIVELGAKSKEPELAVRGLAWVVTTSVELGDRSALDEALTDYARLADDLRQPRYLWYATTRTAMRAILSGAYAEGATLAGRGRDLARRAGEPDVENVHVSVLFPAWVEGLSDGADRRALAEAAGVARDTRVRDTLEFARLLWDAYDGTDPDYRRTAARLPDPMSQARDMHWAFNVACLAGAVVRHHDVDRAEPLMTALAPYAGTGVVWAGGVAFFGATAHWLGVLAATLGDLRLAHRYLTAGLHFHERFGAHPWVARSRFELARVALASGEPDQAAAHENAARRSADRMGMSTLSADLDAWSGTGVLTRSRERVPGTS